MKDRTPAKSATPKLSPRIVQSGFGKKPFNIDHTQILLLTNAVVTSRHRNQPHGEITGTDNLQTFVASRLLTSRVTPTHHSRVSRCASDSDTTILTNSDVKISTWRFAVAVCDSSTSTAR